MSELSAKIDEFFHITERGSDLKTEIKGGVITFLAMFYILAVNPAILSAATGPELFDQLVTATALASCISCILMGLYAKFPIALAPGMGINAFVAYTIVLGMGFTYNQALLVVLVSGIAFFVLTVSGLRKKILHAIPIEMKLAITAGIGFFIVVVGLFNAGIIIHANGSALELGDFSAPGTNLALVCIIITMFFWARNNWGAVLIGIVATIVIGLTGGALFGWDTVVNGAQLIPGVGTAAITGIVSMPDFGLIGAVFDIGSIETTMWLAFIVSTISLIIIDMFDTTGTIVGVARSAGMMDEKGEIKGNEKALEVDAVATVLGAVAGTSTTTSFIESSTGISVGARTGLMAVIVGLLFMVTLFFVPVFAIITPACTVGALFLVGLSMVTALREVQWNDRTTVATVFVTLFMMGLSGSITNGIALGTITYIICMVGEGKWKDVSPILWIFEIIFLAHFIIIYEVVPNL